MSNNSFTEPTIFDGPVRTSEDQEKVRQERADLRASELALVRQRLAASADGHLHRAANAVVESPTKRLSDSDYRAFTSAAGHAVRLAKMDDELGKVQSAYEARVTKEPRVYGKDADNSFYIDMGLVASSSATSDTAGTAGPAAQRAAQAAQQRLARYDVELAHESRVASPEGRRADRIIAEACRTNSPYDHRRVAKQRVKELRALGTGGGATASAAGGGAAAFVSPYFLFEEWAPFRGAHRTFADCCASVPLPKYGMQIYLPTFSSTSGVAQFTELGTVTETDPSATLQGAQVVTVSGQITLSQILHDRGFRGDGSFDVLLGAQLRQQLDEKINLYALNQALASAGSVAGAGAFTMAGLYADLAKAREILTDTAGTRLRPTHLLTTSDFYSYVTRQVDSQSRPLVVPTFAPGFPIAAGDAQTPWSRFTGTVMPGGVLWFTDDVIPTVGTAASTQLVVSAPDEAMVLMEGEPVLALYPQSGASSLESVLNLRAYVAAVPRYPSGTASIVGAAYPASLV